MLSVEYEPKVYLVCRRTKRSSKCIFYPIVQYKLFVVVVRRRMDESEIIYLPVILRGQLFVCPPTVPVCPPPVPTLTAI